MSALSPVNRETLIGLAELSQAAYGAGVVRLGAGVEVLSARRRGIIGAERSVLAIRGSDWGGGLPVDWARNLAAALVRLPPPVSGPGRSVANTLGVMRAHAGFADAAARVINWLRRTRGLNGSAAAADREAAQAWARGELIVTGHSLGGAVAQLVALLAPRNVLGAASFGAPAVGNAAAAAALGALVTRVEYRRDPVPGALDRLGYVRGGTLVSLGGPSAAAWIEDMAKARLARQALADHAIGAYLAALRESDE